MKSIRTCTKVESPHFIDACVGYASTTDKCKTQNDETPKCCSDVEDANEDEREPETDKANRLGPEFDVVLKAVLKSLSQVSPNTFRNNALPVLYAGP